MREEKEERAVRRGQSEEEEKLKGEPGDGSMYSVVTSGGR